MKILIKNRRIITAVADYLTNILIEIKSKAVFKNLIVTLIFSLLVISNIYAGIRCPGKYAGVVIFDQWDTCYLHSGTYVMYIAEKKKKLLRKYTGQSIVIDAKEISQPMNPGDGLITEFEFIGNASVKKNLPHIEGLRFTITPKFGLDKKTRFELMIENKGKRSITFLPGEIAPTLFGAGREVFSPSDGKSEAKLTRNNFNFEKTGRKDFGDTPVLFSEEIKNLDSFPYSFQLNSGEKYQFTVSFAFPPGNYDFLFGYGGGVHEGKSLDSNMISFSVDKNGNGHVIETKAQNPKGENKFDSDFMKLFFNNFSVGSLFSKFQIL